MPDRINLVSPLGRIVRGPINEKQTHKYGGAPYLEGENAPRELGLAIRKDDPATMEYLTKLYQKACQDAPHLKSKIDMEWASGFTAGIFAFKVRDGDKPNEKGVVNPNTVGHYVLNFQTYRDLKFTYTNQYGLNLTDKMGQPIRPTTDIDPKFIKVGDFANVAASVVWNENSDGTAGIYHSHSAVMLAAYGEAISGGPSLADAFANVPTGQLPAGASVASVGNIGSAPAALPTGAATDPLPGGAPVTQAAAAPAPGGMPSLPTAAPIEPHTAFLNNAPAGLPLPGQ